MFHLLFINLSDFFKSCDIMYKHIIIKVSMDCKKFIQ